MKKILSVILSIILIVSVFPLGVFSITAFGETSGTTGDCTWSLDGTTLTISGNGKMGNYTSSSSAPWGKAITEAIIEDGVTSIGNCAFYNCTSLTSTTIPDSVTSIGYYAFYNCTGLESITLPFVGSTRAANMTYDAVFGYIFGYTAISASGLTRQYYGSGSSGYYYYYIPVNLKSVTITDATRIPYGAFYNCSSLTNITIHDGVTSIGDNAFYNCIRLKSINIPDSVTNIGNSAFYNTGYYNNNANWENNVLYIDRHLIDANTSISGECIIRDGTFSILEHAFYNCSSLTSITIPDSVTSIGYYAFSGCSSLTNINIPESVTAIEDYTFSDCSKLTNITIPDNVVSIGDYAFNNCAGLTNVNVPDNVTVIGNGAFSNCSTLKELTIPFVGAEYNGVNNKHFSYIFGGSDAATGYSSVPASLEKVIISGGNRIDDSAFYKCGNIKEIVIENNVKTIGDSAFYMCADLEKITIPRYTDNINSNAFEGCDMLTIICYKGSAADQVALSEIINVEYLSCDHIYDSDCDINCNVCGEVRETVHTYDSDCDENCNKCGYFRETIHLFDEWVIDITPSCYEAGLQLRKCIVCGQKEEQEIPISHSYDDWEIDTAPTCTENGLAIKVCSVCGTKEEKVIPAGHNYSICIKSTAANCNENGIRVMKCSNCGEQTTTETSCGHIYKDGKCVSCDISAEVVESAHNYDRNTDYTWTVTKENATSLSVTFSDDTETETKYDFIYIYDGEDNLIGEYDGTELAGQTVTISCNTVKLRLVSDNSSQKYGFYATVTPESIIGDTNGDCAVNALDMLNIQDAILTGAKTDAYDINGDGLVNLIDLVRIKKILAGKA